MSESLKEVVRVEGPDKGNIRVPRVSGFGQKVVASYTDFFGENFDPYYTSMFRNLLGSTNRSFFPEYFRSYNNNTYTSFACDYLYSQLIDFGWTVEGPGAKKIKRFFETDKTYDKINYTMHPIGGCTLYGMGMMDLKKRGDKLISTRPLNPLRIGGNYDYNTGEIRYSYSDDVSLRGTISTDKYGYLNPNNIFTNSLIYDPFEPFPITPLRSTLLLFTILYDMNGDIAEAVKRVAYAPFIIYVNTDGVEESLKDTFVSEMSTMIDDTLSASTNLCLDDRHRAGTAGSLGGGGSAQLLPVNDLMVPLLSISLSRFCIPLGLIIQDGANKAIMDKQMEATQKQLLAYRDRQKNNIESLFPSITGKDAELVWKVPLPSTAEMTNLRTNYLELLEKGVVDVSYVQDKLNLNVLTGNESFRQDGVL